MGSELSGMGTVGVRTLRLVEHLLERTGPLACGATGARLGVRGPPGAQPPRHSGHHLHLRGRQTDDIESVQQGLKIKTTRTS